MTDRDAAPDTTDPNATENSIRGWQLLAEKRRDEAEAIRAERDSLAAKLAEHEGTATVRRLTEDYPAAAELFLQQGAERITPADEPLLAQLEATINGYEPFIDPNSARRRPPAPAPQTAAQLAQRIREWDGPIT